MTARFERDGVLFEYPENWELDVEEDTNARLAVSVYSPGGGFWSLRVENEPLAPHDVVQSVLAAMREAYDQIDTEETTQVVEGCELLGVDIQFICLDLTNSAQVRAARFEIGTLMILMQAEDREFAQLEPIFLAMTTSLLRRLSMDQQF
jgi:hypothetical protein